MCIYILMVLSHYLYIFIDAAADDIGLTERVTVTRHFKDKVVQPILKVFSFLFLNEYIKYLFKLC